MTIFWCLPVGKLLDVRIGIASSAHSCPPTRDTQLARTSTSTGCPRRTSSSGHGEDISPKRRGLRSFSALRQLRWFVFQALVSSVNSVLCICCRLCSPYVQGWTFRFVRRCIFRPIVVTRPAPDSSSVLDTSAAFTVGSCRETTFPRLL